MERFPARRAGVRTSAKGSRREFCGVDEIALLGKIGETKLGNGRMRWLRAQGAWAMAVGWHVRKVTRPCSLRCDTLTVEVRDRAWMSELEKLTGRITARMKELMPDDPVRKVVFRIGPARHDAVERRAVTASVDRPGNGRSADGGEMRGSLEKVDDEGLRERLELIIDRYLHRARAG